MPYNEDRTKFNNRKIFIQNDYECIDDGTGVKYIHRLLMEEYLGRKLKSSEEIHHKNKIKRNNFVDNFELITKSKHASKHWNPAISPDNRGSKNSQAKLNEEKVLEILQKVETRNDIQRIANEHNVSFTCIWNIWKGNSWTHILRN